MRKTTVAIFEDDMVNRYIYEKMFKSRDDIALYIFDNPQKGYDKLKEVNADVIFIEAHFNGNFGGIAILENLRPVIPANTILIAITSLLQKGDLETLIAAGFVMCLEKPIVFNEILSRAE